MPPKQKITKEMILKISREIVQCEGIDSINSRNVAKALGCSTQPIFSQYPTMEELRQAVHDYCCQCFESEVLDKKDAENFMQECYLKVVNLARQEKNLFRLIYLSEYCQGSDFINERMNYESNNGIVDQLKKQYDLNDETGKDILQRSSLMVQGIATVIATSNVDFKDAEVCKIMEQTIRDMVAGIDKE